MQEWVSALDDTRRDQANRSLMIMLAARSNRLPEATACCIKDTVNRTEDLTPAGLKLITSIANVTRGRQGQVAWHTILDLILVTWRFHRYWCPVRSALLVDWVCCHYNPDPHGTVGKLGWLRALWDLHCHPSSLWLVH